MFHIRIELILTLSVAIAVVADPLINPSKKTPPSQNGKQRSNILFIIGISTHSHRTAIEPLAHKLVERGHNVTFLTAIRPTKPNSKFHEVSTKSVDEFYNLVLTQLGNDFFLSRLKDKNTNVVPNPEITSQYTMMGAQLYFNSPELKPWMDSSSFDLAIIDNLGNKFGFAIAYKFKAPTIIFSGAGFFSYDEHNFGLPNEASWRPNYFQTNVFTEHLTLYDRVYSALYPLYFKTFMEWLTIPKLDELARRSLGVPEMPSIADLERQASLLFTNQYFSSDYGRSLPPLVVQIGGMHCVESNGSLPKEMEDFIAGAGDEGFVYLSFGTIIHMSKVPDYLLKVFFDTIKSFKMRFLWKWDVDPPNNLPSNVYTAKWFPQQDILAHPKIKGFVTHGGMMSIQQGIYHGVPMIVIPVFADQPYNAKTVSYHKIGIHLELSELTTKVFTDAIREFQNPAFALNAKKASDLFKDRPMPAVDTAAYWTEYVLHHKNTSHLKPLSIHQSWWEKNLLDVWLLLLILSTSVLYFIFKIVKTLLHLCFGRHKEKISKSKKH